MGFSPSFSDWAKKNRDLYVNMGIIVAGKFSDIEKLQKKIHDVLEKETSLKIVYITVTARRLRLIKMKEVR